MTAMTALAAHQDEITSWRRHLHRYPELAYQEHGTSAFVAAKLADWGVPHATGLGGTGIVGTIQGQRPGRRIGLRCDMDALPITEASGVAHAAATPGVMHACGHDGHTAALLAATRHLAQTTAFAGTVYVIFQPAEEGAAGARAMIADGLFERFPMDAVYGLHNWPGLPVGEAGVRTGAMMAANDVFEVTVTGQGAHAAMPHQGADAIQAAARMTTALQQIPARELDPARPGVVSVTQLHGGFTHNVLPDTASLGGTARSLDDATRAHLAARIPAVIHGTAQAAGVTAEIAYHRGYPPTINTAAEADTAAAALADTLGAQGVHRDVAPAMVAEDFAYMLHHKPGAYIWLGAGDAEHREMLHSPRFDFNDRILTPAAAYWVALVARVLAASA